jgi:hypothetical protein
MTKYTSIGYLVSNLRITDVPYDSNVSHDLNDSHNLPALRVTHYESLLLTINRQEIEYHKT